MRLKISQIALACIVIFFFQYSFPTSLRESEFTPKQKALIEREKKIRDDLVKRMDELEQWLAVNTGNSLVPSAAVLIFDEGDLLYEKVTHGRPERLFEMASITKTFIALAVLQLFERGLISLDDPIATYLPIRLENDTLGSPPVTILHILTHTAGLVDGTGAVNRSVHPNLPIPEQRFPAGLRFHYSNQAYNILGLLIPAVTGTPLSEYITRNILVPLEMTQSETPEDIAGSAGIRCSAADLANYISMYLNKGRFKNRRILDEKTFALLFRETYSEPPAEFSEYRGIAFRIWKIRGKIVSYHHAAHMNGAGGFMQIFPEQGAGYLFISNPPVYEKEEYYRFYNTLKGKMLRISDLLVSDGFQPTKFQITLPPAEEMNRYTGRFVNPLDGSSIDIGHPGGLQLVAMKSKGGQRYVIQATSRHTFVYIYPEQSERGEIYDFVWRNGAFDALCLKDGYFLREPAR